MSNINFYTLDDNEATAAVTNMGATSEPDPFQVLVSSGSNLVPMYRMRQTTNGSHLFTMFLDERDVAVNEGGFIPEGIGFWCPGPDAVNRQTGKKLFRLYNTRTGDFFYTIDRMSLRPITSGKASLASPRLSTLRMPLLSIVS
jgi:Repeat of unknown function (DUF5648)